MKVPFNEELIQIIKSPYFDVCAAFILDLFIGDPVYPFHPIRLIGKLISKLEGIFYPKDESMRYAAGMITSVAVIAFSAATPILVLRILSMIENANSMPFPFLSKIFSIFILYSCISMKDLNVHIKRVKRALEKEDIDEAQKELAMIVGRDISNYKRGGIIRACIETGSENLVDGVLSPIFFALIGGAPLAIAYKAINTLDSMIGYKNERYIFYGRFAAKLDDATNLLPARLSVLFISCASFLLGFGFIAPLKSALKFANKSASPNAGWSEAAAAGALGIRLGGPEVYHGRLYEKGYLGDGTKEFEISHIQDTMNIAVLSALLFTVALASAFFAAAQIIEKGTLF